MNNPKISVIMPVYNVAEYLEESINSILNQTLIDDIEVIMIDDGSSDDSKYIIERYALDYENFHAYHKQNCGAGVARNYGLQFAKGEYIHFMDPDDYLNSHAYEKLYNLAVENDCDVVIGNAVKYDGHYIDEKTLFKKSFENLYSDIKINNVNERLSILWDTVLWNKLFKTDFVKSNNISFTERNIFYDDITFTLKSYVLANSIFITQDVVYFWRLGRNPSFTQQYGNIGTFNDCINILDSADKLMDELDVNDEIRNFEYKKWLDYDLKLFLKNLTEFSDSYYDDILFKIHRIVKKIPCEFIEDLNSFKKIMYKMVENNDLGSLINFSYLEDQLMKNPIVLVNLDEEYCNYIDFLNDAIDEDLITKKINVDNDSENILISFDENINYVSKSYPHQIRAVLSDDENEYELVVVNQTIKIPFDLLKNFNQKLYINTNYLSDKFNKQAYLTSNKRQLIRFDEFEVEFGIEMNKRLTINVRKTNKNLIKISEIKLYDGGFEFKGISDNPIENIVLENLLTFNRIDYPINFEDNFFTFKIPYSDLSNCPIKKWEIKTDSLFDCILLPKKFIFYKKNNKITFLNELNKILIEQDTYNNFEELHIFNNKLNEIKKVNYNVKTEHKELNDEHYYLIAKNIKLKNKLEEFKSRKIVRFTDKIKK